jgi:RimJ/RimL family protein N-acetyltransferase
VAKESVDPASIHLKRGKGSSGRGGGPGGKYWHIHVGDERVGNVYVNVIDEPPLGEHVSLQIQINKARQGEGIGKIAYRLASEDSGHDVVYAHMSKKNVASRKAAEAAGYEVVDDDRVRQLLMRWSRT